MHVDGFRFDLATALARQDGGFDQTSAFFDLVAQDPVVSRAKLIAEPWDVGQGDSYDLGRFPPLWSEWNGRYRDTHARLLARPHSGAGRVRHPVRRVGRPVRGARRRPSASVNLVTVHDGFTLRDLVSYDGKHNEANGEANRDGTDDNRSWNCGAEGPTDDPPCWRCGRAVAGHAGTLLLSLGVPLLLGGDEMGRTQGGNNNAYCQDDEISWVDWSAGPSAAGRSPGTDGVPPPHPVFRRRRYLTGVEAGELGWFTPAARR